MIAEAVVARPALDLAPLPVLQSYVLFIRMIPFQIAFLARGYIEAIHVPPPSRRDDLPLGLPDPHLSILNDEGHRVTYDGPSLCMHEESPSTVSNRFEWKRSRPFFQLVLDPVVYPLCLCLVLCVTRIRWGLRGYLGMDGGFLFL